MNKIDVINIRSILGIYSIIECRLSKLCGFRPFSLINPTEFALVVTNSSDMNRNIRLRIRMCNHVSANIWYSENKFDSWQAEMLYLGISRCCQCCLGGWTYIWSKSIEKQKWCPMIITAVVDRIYRRCGNRFPKLMTSQFKDICMVCGFKILYKISKLPIGIRILNPYTTKYAF